MILDPGLDLDRDKDQVLGVHTPVWWGFGPFYKHNASQGTGVPRQVKLDDLHRFLTLLLGAFLKPNKDLYDQFLLSLSPHLKVGLLWTRSDSTREVRRDDHH